jgi:hypothetical protein
MKEHPIGTRWINDNCEIYEKRDWDWKFLGVSKSQYLIHVMEVLTTDCDHEKDIYQMDENDKSFDTSKPCCEGT